MTATLLESRAGKKDLLRLSVSKVKTFESCPAQYYYSYVLKLDKKDWSFLAFGKFLHRVLEDFHQALMESSDKNHAELMTLFFKEALKIYKLNTEQKKEGQQIIQSYLKVLKDQKENGTLPTFLKTEKEFNVDIDGKILLNGFIDRIQLDSDGILHISDYKTNKNFKFLEKDLFQLQTYAFVALLENPDLEKIRTSYVLLRHDFKSVVKEWSRPEILQIEDIYRKYAQSIEEEQVYRAKPSILCSYCNYLDKCKDGRKFLQSIGKLEPDEEDIKFW